MYLRTWGNFNPQKKLGFANYTYKSTKFKSANSRICNLFADRPSVHKLQCILFYGEQCENPPPFLIGAMFLKRVESQENGFLLSQHQTRLHLPRLFRDIGIPTTNHSAMVVIHYQPFNHGGIPLPTIQPWWYSTTNHSTMVVFHYQPFNHGGIPLPTIQPWWYSTINHSTMVVFHYQPFNHGGIPLPTIQPWFWNGWYFCIPIIHLSSW